MGKVHQLVGILFALSLTSAAVSATPLFSTGNPDGRMATAARPDTPSIGKLEIETGDDFVLAGATGVDLVSFIGLLPAGYSLDKAQDSHVKLELYRVFNLDSAETIPGRCQDVDPHANCPTDKVPTRKFSPADVARPEFDRQTSDGTLACQVVALDAATFNPLTAGQPTQRFHVANSVKPGGIKPKAELPTGGSGPVDGDLVKFLCRMASSHEWTFSEAEHFFFVPQVALPLGQDNADLGDFLWLSAPKPIGGGTPFPAINLRGPVTADLQSWTRAGAINPDWERIGTDIVGGNPAPTFNAAFALYQTHTSTQGPRPFLANGDTCPFGNPCFNAGGTRQVCCPGGCTSQPGREPKCAGTEHPVFPQA